MKLVYCAQHRPYEAGAVDVDQSNAVVLPVVNFGRVVHCATIGMDGVDVAKPTQSLVA